MKVDTKKIGDVRIYCPDREFDYGEIRCKRNDKTVGRLTIVLKELKPVHGDSECDLALVWSASSGELTVRGNFFEVAPDVPKKAKLVNIDPGVLKYEVKEDPTEALWVIEMEYPQT